MPYADNLIRRILDETRSVAVVGASANPGRPSHGVMRWWIERGCKVVAINPGLGPTLLGAPVVSRLADLPEPVDMVDVFRNSEAAAEVVDEVLALAHRPKVVWMQLEVINASAAARAEAAGITVIMDRCPVIEARRLGVMGSVRTGA